MTAVAYGRLLDDAIVDNRDKLLVLQKAEELQKRRAQEKAVSHSLNIVAPKQVHSDSASKLN